MRNRADVGGTTPQNAEETTTDKGSWPLWGQTARTVYRESFPHLNLRQWSGAIYTWLTQPVLDPTSSGRVVMDYLMKLVTTALEWSYAAGETDVRAEILQAAAELLTLRRDAIRMIDGAGPSVEVHRSDPAEQGSVSGTELGVEPERVSRHANQQQNTTETVGEHTEMASSAPSDRNERAANRDPVGDQMQTANTPKCSFPGVVSIELKRFLDSGIALVECPDCARMRSLEPRNGVLRFPSHDKRKTRTPQTDRRWAKRETAWEVVGG